MARTSRGPRRGRPRGKPSIASAAINGPSWKPEKSSATGNYGKLVSAAAKARNAARKGGTPTGSAQPVGGGGITSPGFNPRPVGGGSINLPGSASRAESIAATATRLKGRRPSAAAPSSGKPASAAAAIERFRPKAPASLMPASMAPKVAAARKRSRY